MGLKSSTVSGLLFLGIKAMRELLMLVRSIMLLKKSANNLKKSAFIMGLHFLINFPLKPSGPGAWSIGIALITLRKSSSLKSAAKNPSLAFGEGMTDHRRFH
jgi:hypothetical protein